MAHPTIETITEAVKAAGRGKASNPRLEQCVNRLVEVLHGLVRELQMTDAEMVEAVQVLTELGKQDQLQILVDVLGVSALVDLLSYPGLQGATPTDLEGPFYRSDAPLLQHPAKLYETDPSEPLFLTGMVTDHHGTPLVGAMLDVWQTNSLGRYEHQDPRQPEYNFRGRLMTDAQGRYEFQTVRPGPYPLPHDGALGRFFEHLGRHPWRTAHIHIKVSRDGYAPLTTQLFFKEDPYIDSDAVFSVKDDLILDPVKIEDQSKWRQRRLDRPYYEARFNFGLWPPHAGQQSYRLAASPADLSRKPDGIKVTRLYTGPDGESHFEDMSIALTSPQEIGRLSVPQKATSIIFRQTDTDYDYDWHHAPRRQYIINLEGEVEITVGDGTKRRFGAGDVLLVEDMTGRGHISRAVNSAARKSIFVALE